MIPAILLVIYTLIGITFIVKITHEKWDYFGDRDGKLLTPKLLIGYILFLPFSLIFWIILFIKLIISFIDDFIYWLVH
jgi:hypothetical protein